ncbi:MAG: YicC/YloC family endoribonuclease [Paracoccaceae bacterium]
MTGFASLTGTSGDQRWNWELRSVNARGLDLRLRLPEGLDDLEQVLRKALKDRTARGNVSISLRLEADKASGAPVLDHDQLERMIEALGQAEAMALDAGLHLRASTAADILALRGVCEPTSTTDDSRRKALVAELKGQVAELANAFARSRADEGRALGSILRDQVSELKTLVAAAGAEAEARRDEMAGALRANLARVLENVDGIDESRVAQELALLAIKADVAEEIDRLSAHCDAADALLATEGPVGRKLDFLMQEFNREANTLCSKSGSSELTRIGLSLKELIDRMREQVQNVE